MWYFQNKAQAAMEAETAVSGEILTDEMLVSDGAGNVVQISTDSAVQTSTEVSQPIISPSSVNDAIDAIFV